MVHKGKKAYLKNQKNLKGPKTSKKAKIIVRNLPFKSLSEESVKEFFKEYGDIQEVKLLKKEDGKFVGCGFVQFEKVSSAAKAIRHANQKEMNGRKIVVDWALPKNTFLEKVQKLEGEFNITNNIKSDDESEKFEVCDIKEEPDESGSESGDNSVEVEDSDEDDDDDDDHDDNDDDDNENAKKFKTCNRIDTPASSVNKSNDIEDGRTVFVRNIPFSATNEDLKNCFEPYGPIEYALICSDKLTEHSKGSGFVKFKDKESATQSMRDSTKIYLQENPLTVSIALSKSDLENKKNCKKTAKDSRNLYLIREGVVVAGSKAAVGVSAGDMAKRLQLEQWKNQILKNLNMFVSKTRLVVHNLPPHFDDSALKNLFAKHSNPKAVIREAKVMYDRKKLDVSGRGVSKEVGFVSFAKHEDALHALRSVNNNPDVFTSKKRPIVAFSIENKAVINSKIKRVEKSRAKLGVNSDELNKMSKLNRKQRRFIKRRKKFIERRKEAQKLKETQISDESKSEKEKTVSKKRKCSGEDGPLKKRKTSPEASQDGECNAFTGLTSKSGTKVKLRSKFRLKNQANVHQQTLKEERRKRRERERKKMTFRKAPKEKKGKTKLIDDTSLSKLLKKHRENVQQFSVTKKWYDN